MAFFNEFEQAEQQYLGMDRKDLAIDLRVRLGDWFRVLELMRGRTNAAGDDLVKEKASNAVGMYFYERQNYDKAASFFRDGRNYEMLADCYYLLEDFDALISLERSLPEHHPLIQVNSVITYILTLKN
jgi:WD repeat-containing protein 35